MARNKIHPDSLYEKNSDQARKRIKRQRREIAGNPRGTNKRWLKSRRRVRRGVLGR